MHERLDEGDLALVARRKLPHLAREVARQSVGQLVDQGPVDAAAQGAQEAQVLGARQVAVQGQLSGDVADAAAQLDALALGVVPQHEGRAGRGPDEVQEQADGRRLAGPVRAQKPEDLARCAPRGRGRRRRARCRRTWSACRSGWRRSRALRSRRAACSTRQRSRASAGGVRELRCRLPGHHPALLWPGARGANVCTDRRASSECWAESNRRADASGSRGAGAGFSGRWRGSW